MAAEAAMEAADRRLVRVPVPDALRTDPRDLWDVHVSLDRDRHVTEQDGVRFFNADAIVELKRQRTLGICWATSGLAQSEHLAARTLAARGAEILAAGEQFEADRKAALDASGAEEAENELIAAQKQEDQVEFQALKTPTRTAGDFAIKLAIFERLWRKFERGFDRDGDEGYPDFPEILEGEGAAADFAVAVAIDLVILLDRARRTRNDPELASLWPLAEIVARIARKFTRTRKEAARALAGGGEIRDVE
jgi:hypothetical protein